MPSTSPCDAGIASQLRWDGVPARCWISFSHSIRKGRVGFSALNSIVQTLVFRALLGARLCVVRFCEKLQNSLINPPWVTTNK